MSETRIIAKDDDVIYSILSDAKLDEDTMAAAFHPEDGKWHIETFAMWFKWIYYFEVKEYNESMEVPAEIVEEIKRKQKEYDERRAAHKRGERLEE